MLTWEILTKAFRYVYGYRMQLGKALLFPLSIMAAIGLYESDSESISWLSLITVFLAEILVHTVVAINTHRIILMGPPSVPEWGIFKPSKRELIFILYSISIGLITIPLSLFALIPIIGFPVAFLAIAYVIGRSSLVFPAVATDHRWTFSDSWRATKNYQILMMVIAVGFPIIMGLPEFLLGFFPHATMLAKIVSVLTFVFVVAALSIAFKAIANERNES